MHSLFPNPFCRCCGSPCTLIVAQLNDDDEVTTDDLLHDSSIAFDAGTLSLTFKASVEYVGLSADGGFDHDFNLGIICMLYLTVFGCVCR